MKDFLLILLGKEINGTVNDSVEGVFRSECYYDWINLKNILSGQGNSEKFPEDLLVASYEEEIVAKQEAMDNDMHVQQGIIAIPADDSDDEDKYKKYLKKIKKAGIIFISFISIFSWSREEKEEILSHDDGSANEQVKKAILDKLDKTSMRLFYTFDHNDFAIICDGEKTELEDYLNVLAKIRAITLAKNIPAIHDITTIYGYKSTVNSNSKLSAVISVSGQDVFSDMDICDSKSFAMEAIGRYDHIFGCNNITWNQLASISKKLHGENVITSRVHIGCSVESKAQDVYLKKSSPLFNKFKNTFQSKIKAIEFDKLTALYNDEKYIASIKVMLYEIGFVISTTLQRGFSKYNGICYIESYLLFLDYIKAKIVGQFCALSESTKQGKIDEIKKLAEILVDVSNYFYKSILTLDSSIMHSERRFIMSDPYQLSLFDVPPKLIAFYTAVASKMVGTLNVEKTNRYVFLITPDIKKDIYVESITGNCDIRSEINILVIHINESSIYNVTDTIKSLSHEIAHHVGQDSTLRKKRASYFVKCYIALLLKNGLDADVFPEEYEIDQIITSIEKIVNKIYNLVKRFELKELLDSEEQYYYMDNLQKNIHFTLIKKLQNVSEINNNLYRILQENFNAEVIKEYLKKSKVWFVNTDNTDMANDCILTNYAYGLILDNIYSTLKKNINESNSLEDGVQNIRFIFKEGYADIQMLLLTQNPEMNKNEFIKNYFAAFENATDNVDEVMRKYSVINTFFAKEEQKYDELLESDFIKDKFYKAYLIYICKQATLYFSEVKSAVINDRTEHFDEIYDCSATSLFKHCNMSEIIRHVDDTIDSYIEGMF